MAMSYMQYLCKVNIGAGKLKYKYFEIILINDGLLPNC